MGTPSTQKRSFTASGTPPSGASVAGAGASSATQRNAPSESVAARSR